MQSPKKHPTTARRFQALFNMAEGDDRNNWDRYDDSRVNLDERGHLYIGGVKVADYGREK